jgi:hypothetical protein
MEHRLEFIAKRRLDVTAREASLLTHQAWGQGVDLPAQLGEAEVDQLALHLPSLSGLLRGVPALRSLLDQAPYKRLQVSHGRGWAEGPEGALEVGAQAQPDLPRGIGW